jgi:DNA-binding NarL/FixJ family response regulator
MTDSITILVVDDHPLFRLGVVHSLSLEPGFTVVAETSGGEAALAIARSLLPKLVLLDVDMPGWSGIETAQKIALACPHATIVMMSESEDRSTLLAAFKAGARGFVRKGVSSRQLADIIRSTAAGEVYVSPAIAADMVASLSHLHAPDPLRELTPREREILGFIGKGLTNREIAERVFRSDKTIKHYVTNILQKLQVRSRVEAALFAARQTCES